MPVRYIPGATSILWGSVPLENVNSVTSSEMWDAMGAVHAALVPPNKRRGSAPAHQARGTQSITIGSWLFATLDYDQEFHLTCCLLFSFMGFVSFHRGTMTHVHVPLQTRLAPRAPTPPGCPWCSGLPP